MTFAITKKFIDGPLACMEYKELSGVRFEEGKRYKDYVCLSCKEISDDSTIQMTAIRPRKYGGGEVFVSGTYNYIKICKRQWKNNGYFNFHCWAD